MSDSPVWPAIYRARRGIHLQVDGTGRRAAIEKAPDGREIRQRLKLPWIGIEAMRAAVDETEAHVTCNQFGVVRPDTKSEQRTDVTEDSVFQAGGFVDLGEVLMRRAQNEIVLACFAPDQLEALTGERLELVCVEVEGPSLGLVNGSTCHGRVGDGGGQEGADDVCRPLVELPLWQTCDENATFVHNGSDVHGRLALANDMGEIGVADEGIELVLQRCDDVAALLTRVGVERAAPIRLADVRVGDAIDNAPTKVIVDQESSTRS